MSAAGKGPPGGPDDRVGGVDATRGTRATDAASAADAIEGTPAISRVDEVKAARAAEVQAVQGAAPVGAAAQSDAVAEVAAALRAGTITVADAVDRLIEDALGRRIGRAIEQGSELEARLRRVLRDYAGADPLISAKIRRLEARRGTRGR